MVEKSVKHHLNELLAADYYTIAPLVLDSLETQKFTTVYLLTAFCGFSGSPAISDDGKPLIQCAEFLSASIKFEMTNDGGYQVRSYWEPSKETYESDITTQFTKEIAQQLLTDWAAVYQQFLESNNDWPEDIGGDGPIWPVYPFSMGEAVLCNLAEYNGEGDIYTTPIRYELAKRFCQDSVSLLNTLGTLDYSTQEAVSDILTSFNAEDYIEAKKSVRQKEQELTANGREVFQQLF